MYANGSILCLACGKLPKFEHIIAILHHKKPYKPAQKTATPKTAYMVHLVKFLERCDWYWKTGDQDMVQKLENCSVNLLILGLLNDLPIEAVANPYYI